MKKFEEKTVNKDVLYEGKIITLQVEEVELPNGKTSKREIIKHPGAVCVIAVNGEGKLIMVEQYRKAFERSILEIPAGKLEPGEEPIITAARELEEETGYGCDRLVHLQSFYTSPGFADELVHVFEAKGLYKIENAKGADEDEFVELHEITLEEAEECVADQRIFDAKTAYAVQYLRLQRILREQAESKLN
ncbi:NUDIX hydrolase [Jeotgalibacillus proteolyticus]|uniref:ADP-ribose pyrophosphatase n=1 Tax=Jeotgalibacillus proteolyticus TaxID=2082395 RepID=A0A2S5GEB0_9BACL|nr:NUDIX hydrolase [Jeotgalibacillus proteolyticus]PPA71319.1 ADP-ribose pyrophosphatase [Jeotgalibacillus proteolyticus]